MQLAKEKYPVELLKRYNKYFQIDLEILSAAFLFSCSLSKHYYVPVAAASHSFSAPAVLSTQAALFIS